MILMWYQNVGTNKFFSFCHKARVLQRDGRTDVAFTITRCVALQALHDKTFLAETLVFV